MVVLAEPSGLATATGRWCRPAITSIRRYFPHAWLHACLHPWLQARHQRDLRPSRSAPVYEGAYLAASITNDVSLPANAIWSATSKGTSSRLSIILIVGRPTIDCGSKIVTRCRSVCARRRADLHGGNFLLFSARATGDLRSACLLVVLPHSAARTPEFAIILWACSQFTM